MKISEIFESKINEARVDKPSPGATWTPKYFNDTKQIRGSVKDWLTAMDIAPADVQTALKKIKATDLFKNQTKKVGLAYKESTAEKNGTLEFQAIRNIPRSSIDGAGRPIGRELNGKNTVAYLVYANGQIRHEDKATGHMTPLKTPKPRMVKDDPVATLINIYTAAIEEVIAKQIKHNNKVARSNLTQDGK